MLPIVFSWIVLATISLGIQFFHDVREMVVDSRRNFFMLGVTIMLGSALQQYGVYFCSMLAMIIWVFLLGKIEKRMELEVFGDGDKELFMWLVPGLIIVNINAAILFLITFAIINATFVFYFVYIKKNKVEKIPGLIFITLAWLFAIYPLF